MGEYPAAIYLPHGIGELMVSVEGTTITIVFRVPVLGLKLTYSFAFDT